MPKRLIASSTVSRRVWIIEKRFRRKDNGWRTEADLCWDNQDEAETAIEKYREIAPRYEFRLQEFIRCLTV
jgi:hypothetical protein